MFSIQRRLEVFEGWFQLCDLSDPELIQAIDQASRQNPWFTVENCELSVRSIATHMLLPAKLKEWMDRYELPEGNKPLTVGLTLAGNIPMVGFQDILCVLATGHHAQIKLSDKDAVLLPYFINKLQEQFPFLKDCISIVDRLEGFDAIIATGSDNAARYFDFYFSKYPHIIRKNRNSMGILDGNESQDKLMFLGNDVFQYFGLGCRNVSMVWLPNGYDIPHLLDTWDPFHVLMNNSKFKNNFDYNCALYIMNGAKHYHSDYVVLLQEKRLASRIGVLNYAFYDHIDEVRSFYETEKDRIQCVVSEIDVPGIPTIGFGDSQSPGLMDYADGIDVMEFLINLKAHA